MENKQAKESIDKAIEYFDNLQTASAAGTMEEKFQAAFIGRLEKFLDGQSKAASKEIVKKFLRQCSTDYITLAFRESMQEACLETKRFLMEAIHNARYYGELQEELYIAEQTLKHRREEIEKLESSFPDPKARCAYELYKRISASEAREDAYTKQRRITSAGLVAAAYLGLQRYEINPAKQQKQE